MTDSALWIFHPVQLAWLMNKLDWLNSGRQAGEMFRQEWCWFSGRQFGRNDVQAGLLIRQECWSGRNVYPAGCSDWKMFRLEDVRAGMMFGQEWSSRQDSDPARYDLAGWLSSRNDACFDAPGFIVISVTLTGIFLWPSLFLFWRTFFYIGVRFIVFFYWAEQFSRVVNLYQIQTSSQTIYWCCILICSVVIRKLFRCTECKIDYCDQAEQRPSLY